MGGSSGSKTKVVQYFMSAWWGFSVGPVDALKKIIINDKVAWTGNADQSCVIKIDDQDLFGGVMKEGGILGNVVFLNGKSTQTIPEYLAAKLGLTTATCPAHRGIASLFFTGGAEPADGGTYGNGKTSIVYPESTTVGGLNGPFASAPAGQQAGFYQRAKYPAAPTIEIEARRSPKGLDPAFSMIGDDANPIHIAFEVYTSTKFGAGVPAAAFDTGDLNAIAEVVHGEGIGVSLLWNEQQSCEAFANTILGYVNAVPFFVHPETGLLTTKLIRGDYVVGDLLEITPDNAKLSGFQRKLWGETVNELTVTWTNPESEEEETVTVQDLGNMAMQGAPVAETRDYKGLRSAANAITIGKRDLRVSSYPLMTCKAVVNRSAATLVPGSVVRLTWPEHGITDVVMRVGDVDRGEKSDSAITLNLMEDIFGLEVGEYSTPDGSLWAPTTIPPQDPDFTLVTTMPHRMLSELGISLSNLTPDKVRVAVLAADNSKDMRNYMITFEKALADGTTVWAGSETRTMASRATLSSALPFEYPTSVVYFTGLTPGTGIRPGSFCFIGSTETTQEIGIVMAIGTDNVTIRRGVMDTTPKAWGVGAQIWFAPRAFDVMDNIVRTAGLPVTYKLLTTTSQGTLAIADATEIERTPSLRPHLPLRPANCAVNGNFIGPVAVGAATDLSLTWANRNKLTEDGTILSWNSASVTPEVGQTTTIHILNSSNTILSSINGITGTSYTLPVSALGSSWTVRKIKFVSKDSAGDESLQGHIIELAP